MDKRLSHDSFTVTFWVQFPVRLIMHNPEKMYIQFKQTGFNLGNKKELSGSNFKIKNNKYFSKIGRAHV